MRWSGDYCYLQYTNYHIYMERTCYIAKGVYSFKNHYEKSGYTILEWSDYMQKEFTKADLKDGMVVEYEDKSLGKSFVHNSYAEHNLLYIKPPKARNFLYIKFCV